MLSLMMVLCVLDEYDVLEGATDIYIHQAQSPGPYRLRMNMPSCGIASWLLPQDYNSRQVVCDYSV